MCKRGKNAKRIEGKGKDRGKRWRRSVSDEECHASCSSPSCLKTKSLQSTKSTYIMTITFSQREMSHCHALSHCLRYRKLKLSQLKMKKIIPKCLSCPVILNVCLLSQMHVELLRYVIDVTCSRREAGGKGGGGGHAPSPPPKENRDRLERKRCLCYMVG